jgi:hypothetical protein
MLHIELAAAGLTGWQAAHDWLTRAICDGLSTGPNAGLFHGAPALAFALHAAPHVPGTLRPAGSWTRASASSSGTGSPRPGCVWRAANGPPSPNST